MARIASTVRVSHLVVAGVSNWGAYGIVAALSRLSGQMLLHEAAQERRLVERVWTRGPWTASPGARSRRWTGCRSRPTPGSSPAGSGRARGRGSPRSDRR